MYVYNELDSTPSPNKTMLFVPLKTTYEVGDSAKFLVSSNEENCYLRLHIESKNRNSINKWIQLNNSQKIISIPITKSLQGGFYAYLTSIKHQQIFHETQKIEVPYTDKKLDVFLSTYRNKVKPGAKETWTITINDNNKKPIKAELLVSMYDASIDKVDSKKKNNWSLNIYKNYDYSFLHRYNTCFKNSNAYQIEKSSR